MIASSLNCFVLLTLITLAVFQPSSQKYVEAGVKKEPSPEHRVKRNANEAIVFTTPRPHRRQTPSAAHGLDRLGPNGPTPSPTNPSPCPNGQKFCDDALDYPREHIKALLRKQPRALLNMFQGPIEEEDSIYINRVDPGANPEMETLCRSVPKRYFPKKAESEVGLFFVVNDEEHKQAIEVDACVNPNETDECEIPANLLSAGYKSRCIQRHLRRVLVVLSRNFSGFLTEPFDFPSCCSCVLVKLDATSSRMASSQSFASATNTTLLQSRRQSATGKRAN